MIKLTLTKEELKNEVWLKIERQLKDNLVLLRKCNDRDSNERETAITRGMILAIKDVLRTNENNNDI